MIPEVLLADVWWSFSEPIPKSPSDLVEEVTKYYAEVHEKPFQKDLLTKQSPLLCLNISYKYMKYIKTKNEWQKVYEKIKIPGNGKYLTYAEILWQIHKAVYENLKDKNHKYFEGLELIDEDDENEKGVPLYDMYLGS